MEIGQFGHYSKLKHTSQTLRYLSDSEVLGPFVPAVNARELRAMYMPALAGNLQANLRSQRSCRIQ